MSKWETVTQMVCSLKLESLQHLKQPILTVKSIDSNVPGFADSLGKAE